MGKIKNFRKIKKKLMIKNFNNINFHNRTFFFNAEKINDVVIDGNSRISKETILIYGNINNGDEHQKKNQ